MISSLLKRALPFVMTLAVGTGLGSVFNIFSPAPAEQVESSAPIVTVQRRHGCDYRRRSASDSTPTKILFQPSVRYTTEARKHQTTGVVQLRVRFGADGKATVMDRLSTLPDGLTEEAERVVERTQFTPATENGEPVSEVKDMNYYFTLDDRVTMGL